MAEVAAECQQSCAGGLHTTEEGQKQPTYEPAVTQTVSHIIL